MVRWWCCPYAWVERRDVVTAYAPGWVSRNSLGQHLNGDVGDFKCPKRIFRLVRVGTDTLTVIRHRAVYRALVYTCNSRQQYGGTVD